MVKVVGVAGAAIKVASGTAVRIASRVSGVANSRARDAYIAGKGL